MVFGIVGVYGKDAVDVAYQCSLAMLGRRDGLTILYDPGAKSPVIEKIPEAQLLEYGEIKNHQSRYACAKIFDERHSGYFAPEYNLKLRKIGVVNTGKLTNKDKIINYLERKGFAVVPPPQMYKRKNEPYGDVSPSQILTHLLSINTCSLEEGIEEPLKKSLKYLKGSFSFSILFNGRLIGVTDRYGMRQLHYGVKEDDEPVYVISSYTSGLERVNVEYLGTLEPAEFIVIDEEGMHKSKYTEGKPRYCIRELLFFARGEDVVYATPVAEFRERCGEKLAEKIVEKGLLNDIDVIAFIPGSGRCYYDGFMNKLHQMGISKFETHDVVTVNPAYRGRIIFESSEREEKIKQKYNINSRFVKDKNVLLIDDGVISGDTFRVVTEKLKSSGAKNVIGAVGSPEPKGSCELRESLGYLKPKSKEDIIRDTGVEEMVMLSAEDVFDATQKEKELFCHDCF
ncbi:MAG: hypothetical protein DRP15_01310 [Candidatus Aenigmatarchaeota archaeon]|nr:MAG: hypothetical protein DRP15_01310 [Candidatus Aenigmarchaeota archaeon]